MTPVAASTEIEGRAPGADPTPEELAHELVQTLRAEADRAREAHEVELEHLAAVPGAVAERRAAEAAHSQARVELRLLVAAHGQNDVVDVPPALDSEGAREAVEAAVDEVKDALAGETEAERISQSTNAVFDRLRAAESPDEVRARVRQIRRRLKDPDWLTDEVAAETWIRPAERRQLTSTRRSVVGLALRWCRSARTGREPGDPFERFPAPVAEVVGAFFDTGAMEPYSGPWVVPRSWFPRESKPNPSERMGERDLEAELRDAIRGLPDEVVEEAVS